ncbi:MAG: hypothetical protein LRY24_01480 [Erysipelotrichaceae bacterium]|nr:hypothetical protein [Erysipelotrichaceae bacterium]
MKKIVLGLVFILFNFNLTLGNVIINLIPSFIGYYFIMNACVILAEKTSELSIILKHVKWLCCCLSSTCSPLYWT